MPLKGDPANALTTRSVVLNGSPRSGEVPVKSVDAEAIDRSRCARMDRSRREVICRKRRACRWSDRSCISPRLVNGVHINMVVASKAIIAPIPVTPTGTCQTVLLQAARYGWQTGFRQQE